jgi:hypothetical protein
MRRFHMTTLPTPRSAILPTSGTATLPVLIATPAIRNPNKSFKPGGLQTSNRDISPCFSTRPRVRPCLLLRDAQSKTTLIGAPAIRISPNSLRISRNSVSNRRFLRPGRFCGRRDTAAPRLALHQSPTAGHGSWILIGSPVIRIRRKSDGIITDGDSNRREARFLWSAAVLRRFSSPAAHASRVGQSASAAALTERAGFLIGSPVIRIRRKSSRITTNRPSNRRKTPTDLAPIAPANPGPTSAASFSLGYFLFSAFEPLIGPPVIRIRSKSLRINADSLSNRRETPSFSNPKPPTPNLENRCILTRANRPRGAQ